MGQCKEEPLFLASLFYIFSRPGCRSGLVLWTGWLPGCLSVYLAGWQTGRLETLLASIAASLGLLIKLGFGLKSVHVHFIELMINRSSIINGHSLSIVAILTTDCLESREIYFMDCGRLPARNKVFVVVCCSFIWLSSIISRELVDKVPQMALNGCN